MNTTRSNSDQHPQAKKRLLPQTQFYIYEDLDLVCDRVFKKDRITIGSSKDADLCLDHYSVEGIHALVHYREDLAFITNKFPQNGLRLNGRSIGLAELQHEDVIDIGPFSLKVKMPLPKVQEKNENENTYAVRLVNRYGSMQAMKMAAHHLSIMMQVDVHKVLPLLSKEHHLLKKDLSGIKAARIQNALLRVGVICDVQTETAKQVVAAKTEMPSAKAQQAKASASEIPPIAVMQVTASKNEKSPVTTKKVIASKKTVQPTPLKQAAEMVSEMKPTEPNSNIPHYLDVFKDVPDPPDASSSSRISFTDNLPDTAVPSQVYFTDNLPNAEAPHKVFFTDNLPHAEESLQVPFKKSITEIQATPTVSFTKIYEDEIDEDDGEIWEAPFLLRAKLDSAPIPIHNALHPSENKQLMVVKTIGDSICDVRFLKGRQKYFVTTAGGRVCLLKVKPKGDSCVSILPSFSGYLESPLGETTADLESYKIPEFQKYKKKPVYHIPLPEKGAVVVEAEGCCYRIASVACHTSPPVTVAETPSNFSWRHWASSVGAHFFLLMCLTAYLYFQAAGPEVLEPRFVKIDPDLLQQLEPLKVAPKPKMPPPKPEPVKVAEKVTPKQIKPVKSPKTTEKASKQRPSNKKIADARRVSKHPKAGGGFGKGNIKNRNINQTGLLSVLGNSTIGGPSKAIASVTNLDAVPVPGATERNFSVGGLKGVLGNGTISVATGGAIMQTKGSKQVLRSAGASGKGDVAALKRGSTGKKKVQGMVSAKLSRTVRIEGGMSREMVKRVIDQHLEEISYCYETALMSNPGISGRIVFEWKILMDGRVGEIRIVASNVNSHEVHGCIKMAIKSWRFPRPTGAEVVVSYPFVFDLVAF